MTCLTHWGRVTHICVSKLTIIGSDNGLSPGRRQAIIWTNAGILLIGPLRTNFSEIFIEMHTFSFKNMWLKMSSAKWQPFCLGLNVLINDTYERTTFSFRSYMSFWRHINITCDNGCSPTCVKCQVNILTNSTWPSNKCYQTHRMLKVYFSQHYYFWWYARNSSGELNQYDSCWYLGSLHRLVISNRGIEYVR